MTSPVMPSGSQVISAFPACAGPFVGSAIIELRLAPLRRFLKEHLWPTAKSGTVRDEPNSGVV